MKRKKNRTDMEFEKKVLDSILEGGSLENILTLIKKHYQKSPEGILLKKVGITSVFWIGTLIYCNWQYIL
jgi:hypothetical protein